MPFTVAHAAAALPFRRLNLVWSAILVGSMAPDFPYVVGWVKYRSLGHDFPGVVFFTLPASFVVLWFFHFAIKNPIAGLLPVGMQQRLTGQLGEFRFGGARRILAITFSIVLGIATHLVWDSFTHAYTWPWRHLVWLRSWVHVPVAGWMRGYGILQYASTGVGLFALAVWVFFWYRNTAPPTAAALPPKFRSRVSLAVLMFAIAGATGIWRASLLASESTTLYGWDRYILHFSVTAIAVAFWELLLYCLITTSREDSGEGLHSA
jgi:Domain of unknown function (DUF4184)